MASHIIIKLLNTEEKKKLTESGRNDTFLRGGHEMTAVIGKLGSQQEVAQPSPSAERKELSTAGLMSGRNILQE